MSKTFYITTPIYYPNANLHMGHAYTTVVCDILARYNRLIGKETYFLTGADENTEKVVRAAKEAGKGTNEYLDEIVENFKLLFSKLEISHDQFIRTSDEENHWPGVIEIWKCMKKSGDIEKRTYEGLYCVGHEAFITEKDLVDGKCPDHNEKPQLIKEENYFFNLSKYTKKIKEKIKSGEMEIIPESRKNEILALLERGLEDISFSRPAEKMSVGVPVPGDSSQKVYVWGDALTNYISALGFGRNDELYKKFWPGMHVIGKDILRFHAAIWPGMLLSAGLPLPKKLLVHGFITSGGKKMSKSLGNTIDPLELIAEYGGDAMRYYLARHISPFEDGDLTEQSFKDAYNANLANGLGNLVSRIMKLAEDNLTESIGEANISYKFEDYLDEKLKKFEINYAMDYIWNKIGELDREIQEKKPWESKDKEIIKNLTKKLGQIGHMLKSFMPQTAKIIIDTVLANKKPEKPLFARK